MFQFFKCFSLSFILNILFCLFVCFGLYPSTWCLVLSIYSGITPGGASVIMSSNRVQTKFNHIEVKSQMVCHISPTPRFVYFLGGISLQYIWCPCFTVAQLLYDPHPLSHNTCNCPMASLPLYGELNKRIR